MRFRLPPVAIVADVEKAFLQIGIRPQDRDGTRFLWLRDAKRPDVVDDNLATYRFCRVPFGLICSPFLLGETIKYHLRHDGSSLAQTLVDNIYVDNIFIGAASVTEAYHIYEQATCIFKKASMKLRQWSSNSHPLLQLLPAADSRSSGTVSVLGIPWNTSTDQFSIPGSPSLQPSDVLTKRQVLSQVTTIYDPLGLINPVTFSGKVFLQEICQSHVSWDEPLPARECGEWDRLTQVLRDIPTLKLPRFQPTLYECTSYELHIFCDASCKSYAATVYLRGTRGQSIATSLVFSKMRLAPFRTRSRPHAKQRRGSQITLPRLELLGALIGVRAGAFVSDQLKLPITKRTVWLDSQCVLHWLKTTKPLSVFVENRIAEIRKNSNTTYCYVPTSQNPADLATRGCTIPQLKASTMWWQGPPWLQLPDNCWPKWNLPDITPTILELVRDEVRGPKFFHETPSTVAVSTLTDGHSTPLASPLSINETRFSSLRTLLRVTAYILKFLTARLWQRLSDDTRANLRRNRKLLSTLLDRSGELLPPSADDLRNARLLWEYTLQRRRFSDVITAIQTRRQHHLVRQLGLKLDDQALLRCHGRFEHATISPTARTPILLSRKEHYTLLVIQEIHERLFHAGTSHTLAQVRDTYWIPQGRVAVRSILTRCTLCKRFDGLPFRLPAMPPWPKERVSRSIPFQFTGLDYVGPVMVRDGQTTTKIWICLFTCLAVRAMHLEYVKDLTSRQFLDCIRRFVARRGPPERIISDNAPQFKLTKTAIDNEFRQAVISHDVLSYFGTHGIKWTFITELAPWHGGFYERLVGVVKQALRKSLGRQLLSFHQMVTLITEIEAVINSRPLTFVYSDLESGFTLTPSHFATMQHCLSLPCSP